MAIWLPGFTRKDLGPDGGAYDTTSNPKLCWHTWEGTSWSGAESAFAKYPPHLAVSPYDGQRRQYVSLDRHAYALKGSDSEDSWVIQVEVAGFASETHTWPDDWLLWLGQSVLAPIRAAVPIPSVIAPQGFHGEGEGIVLASPDSPIRFALRDWDAFAGHVGHQHAPAPDEHWDPGRLNVGRIIQNAQGAPEPTEQGDGMFAYTSIDSGLTVIVCGSKQVRVSGASLTAEIRGADYFIGDCDANMDRWLREAYGPVIGA